MINSSTCLENEDEEGKKKNRKIMKHLPCQTQSDTVLAFSKSCSYSGATPVSCYTPLIKDSVSCPTDQIKSNESTGSLCANSSIKDSFFCRILFQKSFLSETKLKIQIKSKGTYGIVSPFHGYNRGICYKSFSACLKNLINLHRKYLKKTNTLLYKDQKKNFEVYTILSHMSIWKTFGAMKLLSFHKETLAVCECPYTIGLCSFQDLPTEQKVEINTSFKKSLRKLTYNFCFGNASHIEKKCLDGLRIIFWPLRHLHDDELSSWKYNGIQDLWISFLTVFICLQCACTCDKKCNNLCNCFRLLQESKIFKEFFTFFSTEAFRNFATNHCYTKLNFVRTRRWDQQRRCCNQPTPDVFLRYMNTVKFLMPGHKVHSSDALLINASSLMWRTFKDHSKYWIPAKTVRKVNRHCKKPNGSLEHATIVCRCFSPDPLYPKLRSVMICMVLIELNLNRSISSFLQSHFDYYECIRSILTMDYWLKLGCLTSSQMWCLSDIWLLFKHSSIAGLANVSMKVIYTFPTKPLEQEKSMLVENGEASYLLSPLYRKLNPSKIRATDRCSFSMNPNTGILKYGDICLNNVDKNLETNELSSFPSPVTHIKHESTLDNSSQLNAFRMDCFLKDEITQIMLKPYGMKLTSFTAVMEVVSSINKMHFLKNGRKESKIRINQNLVGFITSLMAWWILLCLRLVHKLSAWENVTTTCTHLGRTIFPKLMFCVAFLISQRGKDHQFYLDSDDHTWVKFVIMIQLIFTIAIMIERLAKNMFQQIFKDNTCLRAFGSDFNESNQLVGFKTHTIFWKSYGRPHTARELMQLGNIYLCGKSGCLDKYAFIINVQNSSVHLQSSSKKFFSEFTVKVCRYTNEKQTLHNSFEEVHLHEDPLWTTCNPYSLFYNPSGSLGSEAALQACAGVPISFASDAGGSNKTLEAFFMESIQVLRPMSFRAEDISSILQVLIGYNTHLPPGANVFLPKYNFFYLEDNINVTAKPLHIPELINILSLYTKEMSRLFRNNSLSLDIVNRDKNVWVGLEILCSITVFGQHTDPVLAQAQERMDLICSFTCSILGLKQLLNNQKRDILKTRINNLLEDNGILLSPAPPTTSPPIRNRRSVIDTKTSHTGIRYKYIWMIWIIIVIFLVNVMSYDYYSFPLSEEPPHIKCGYPTWDVKNNWSKDLDLLSLRTSIEFFLYFRDVGTIKVKKKECMLQEKEIEAHSKGKKHDQVRANFFEYDFSSTLIVSGVHGINLRHHHTETLCAGVVSSYHNVHPSNLYVQKVHTFLRSFSVYFLKINAHLKKKNYRNPFIGINQTLRDIFLSMLNGILINSKTLRGMWNSKLLSFFQQVQLGNSKEDTFYIFTFIFTKRSHVWIGPLECIYKKDIQELLLRN